MENFQADLLDFFLKEDEKIILYDSKNSFEITLSLAAAKCFSPVFKTRLETEIGKIKPKDETEKKSWSEIQMQPNYRFARVEVDGFSKETISNFVNCIHGNGGDLELDWERMKELLKMSHFYQVDKLFKVCQELGEKLIKDESIFEAIQLMETYEFSSWCEQCVQLLLSKTDRNWLTSEDWEDALKMQPKTMAALQNVLILRILCSEKLKSCSALACCAAQSGCVYKGEHTTYMRSLLNGIGSLGMDL